MKEDNGNAMDDVPFLAATGYEIETSIYGFLLVNHAVTRIPLHKLHFGKKGVTEKIVGMQKRCNNLHGKWFLLENGEIVVQNRSRKRLKPFLRDELISLIAPPDFPPSPTEEEIRKMVEEYTLEDPFNADLAVEDDAFGEAMHKRFETQESYNESTLRLFDKLVDFIYGMEIKEPKKQMLLALRGFCGAVRRHGIFWEELISDMVNGKVKAGDDVCERYAVPQALQQVLYWIYHAAGFPALVEVRDDTYTVSSLFFEDNTAIVPYWVALMNLCAAPDAIRDILIYSYIERA